MEKFEKVSSDENILESFLCNEINRNEDVFNFLTILDNIDGGMTIALDGKWGSGKTFFVKQVKIVLDAFNEQTVFGNGQRQKVKKFCKSAFEKRSISDTPRACIYYDAWEHDDYEDPLLSIIYEMAANIGEDKSALAKKDLIKAALSIADLVTNRNITGIRNIFNKSDPLEEIRSQKNLHDLISDFLNRITDEWGNSLIVFIDELDRCNPLFAVKLLEQIKHYFCSEKVIFVFSINLIELQHTIKSVYGEEFNASQYLNRFFDMICSLPDVSIDAFSKTFGMGLSDISKSICQYFDFSLRDQAQYYQMLNICGLGKVTKRINGVDYFVQQTLLPIMIGLRIFNYSFYNELVSGKNFSIVTDILSQSNSKKWLLNSFYEKDSMLFLNPGDDEHLQKMLKIKVEEMCKAVFNLEGFEDDYRQRMGQFEIYRDTKRALLDAINSLSPSNMF